MNARLYIWRSRVTKKPPRRTAFYMAPQRRTATYGPHSRLLQASRPETPTLCPCRAGGSTSRPSAAHGPRPLDGSHRPAEGAAMAGGDGAARYPQGRHRSGRGHHPSAGDAGDGSARSAHRSSERPHRQQALHPLVERPARAGDGRRVKGAPRPPNPSTRNRVDSALCGGVAVFRSDNGRLIGACCAGAQARCWWTT